MVTSSECIEIFNAMIRGTPISFTDKILPLISDYLTEINCEKSDKIVSLIVANPQLAQQTLSTLVDYYTRKYCILSISSLNGLNINKTILYYE